MLKVFHSWVDRYFSDEEAILLAVFLLIALGIVLTLGGVLAPVIAGLILAFLMQGLVNKLEKIGVSHSVSVSLIFIAFVGAFGAFVLIVVPEAWRQLLNLLRELPLMLTSGQELLMLLPDRYPELITTAQVQSVIDRAAAELTQLGQWAVGVSLASIVNVITLLIYLILVPVLMFFFMKDGERILYWFASLLPERRDVITQVALEMELQIANYVRGKAVEIVIVGAVSYVAFALFGLRYSALLALMVGLSVLIPYIGAAVVTLPVALIAFFQWGLTSEFMYLMGVYLLIQALDGNALVPLLFSEAVNLHPIAIIVAVLVFGGIWGFWGVFFAIPLATLIKAVLSAWPQAQSSEVNESSDADG